MSDRYNKPIFDAEMLRRLQEKEKARRGLLSKAEVEYILGLDKDILRLSDCMKQPTPHAASRVQKLRTEYMKELMRQIDLKLSQLEEDPEINLKSVAGGMLREVIMDLTTWYDILYSAYVKRLNPPKISFNGDYFT